jgi:hypothetical protein
MGLSEAKKTISTLVIKEPGVSAVGTGRDEFGRDAVVIDMDPAFPDTRERVSKLIENVAADVRVVYSQGGPYRKFPAK